MATRSALPFETHATPLSLFRPQSLSQRTLRPVFKDRLPLPRGRRNGSAALPFVLLARASTDSADQDVTAESKLVQDAAAAEESSSGETKSTSSDVPELPKRKEVSELKEGDVLDAVVKAIVRYGCFLDADCVVDVFVHVSDVADFFIDDVRKLLKRGAKVKVELTMIGEDGRLKGSLAKHNQFANPEKTTSQRPKRTESKRAAPREEAKAYSILESFEGIVEKVTANGAFVKFDDGRSSGYLPIEEMEKEQLEEVDDIRASDLVQEKQHVTVRYIRTNSGNQNLESSALRVLSVDARTKKLTLTMRTAEEVEMDQKAGSDGFFVSDGENSEFAILNAAFRRAGLVREMFANGWEETAVKEEEATVKSQPVAQTALVTEDDVKMEESEQPLTEQQEPFVVEEPQAETVEETSAEKTPAEPAAVAELPVETEKRETEPVANPLESEGTLEIEQQEKQPVSEPSTPEAAVLTDVTSSPESEVVAETEESGVKEKPVQEEIVAKPADEVKESVPPQEEPVVAVDTSTSVPDVAIPTEQPKAETVELRVSASMVKQLREMSGAGMMNCKKALTECNGDMDAALDYLKKKGIASAAKRADKIASEGLIGSYIHMGAKLGVLLEVNSETDFVARTDAFKQFVDNVAMTIAASSDAICISPNDYPAEVLEKEKEVEMTKEDVMSKPEGIREKMVLGRLEKIKKQGAVLEQPFIQDQEKSVQTALTELSASLGEKISIRRFERYELGEGLEKKSTDFATEVADQIETKKAEAAAAAKEEEEEESTSAVAPSEQTSAVKVPASAVKELRQMTGGGLMDCKRALAECDCDLEKAAEYLKKKGLAGAAKKANRLASEGVICSYIHLGSKLGIMAEVNCETDFVSRGEDFKQLADDIAMQLAASPEVDFISQELIPQEVLEKELEIEMAKEDLQQKPEDIRRRIADGRVAKTIKTRCLYDQPFLKDTEKTVGDIIKEHIAKLGENIKVRRFVRYNLGEGIEKKETDFAAEVAEQVQKSS